MYAAPLMGLPKTDMIGTMGTMCRCNGVLNLGLDGR